MSPTVSVVIPTFNRADLILEALSSIQAQTRPVNEVIIIDDGSTDDTQRVVAGFTGRVTYIRQTNAGQAAARNHGMSVAKSDYIAFLDSDDLWAHDRIERQFEALDQFPSLDLVFGREAKFSSQKNFEECAIRDRLVLSRLESARCIVPEPFALLLRENFVPTSTALFRRSCLSAVGFMDPAAQPSEDYDFWLRFALKGYQFGFVDKILGHRRMHEGNLVNQWFKLTNSVVEVLDRYKACYPDQHDFVARRLSGLHYDLGSHLFKRLEFGRALLHLKQSRPSGHTRVVWAAKLASARLLGRRNHDEA